MNLLLLSLFARAAHARLSGAALGTPSWYRPVLVLPCREKRRTSYLVAVLESPGPFVFLTEERPLEGARAPERFIALAGRRIDAVSAPPGDRVLRLDLDAPASGAGEPASLEIHLYGSQGGAQWVRAGSALESVGRRRRSAERENAPVSLVDTDAETLTAAIAGASSDNAIHAVAQGLDDELVAAFTRPDGSIDVVALLSFRDALAAGADQFRLVTARRLGNVVPVPADASVAAGTFAHGPFDSALDGARIVGGLILDGAKRRIVSALARPLRRRLAAGRKLLSNLHRDLDRASGHERLRREAEILAAYQSTIPAGRDSVEVPDVYDPDTRVRIALDPAQTIQAQIEKRFKKAAKLAKSETHARRRITLVERENAELEAAATVLEQSESFAKALLQLEAIRARFDIPPEAPAKEGRRGSTPAREPFRRFELGDGWFALVGRSNAENDELTFKHSNPTDTWLHAQSVPGSHVVLKSSGVSSPPARVLEAAASIAAHFSRAKHSGLVPVVYTQRKYVRKFRGAKPGQVTCEREKTIVVEPCLPKNEAD